MGKSKEMMFSSLAFMWRQHEDIRLSGEIFNQNKRNEPIRPRKKVRIQIMHSDLSETVKGLFKVSGAFVEAVKRGFCRRDCFRSIVINNAYPGLTIPLLAFTSRCFIAGDAHCNNLCLSPRINA